MKLTATLTTLGLTLGPVLAAASPATVGFRSGNRLYVDDRNAYEKLSSATKRVDSRSRSKGFVELEFQNGNPLTINLDEVEFFCRGRCEVESSD